MHKAAQARSVLVMYLIVTTICALLSAVLADSATGDLKLSEEELKQYDGTDAEKPIYLAINGTIYDVSASPAFYGPGGHYHHFTGKDASRAWVTECWDSEDQLTWRMDGVEAMFMPKYLDEQMQQAADGESDIEGADSFGQDEMARMAKLMMEKFGKITDKKRDQRRVADAKEAGQKVHDALAHWIGFFAKNDKYKVAGTVVHDKNKPEPPAICEAALKKRPFKGGLVDDILKRQGKAPIYEKDRPAPVALDDMPGFVREAALKAQGGPQKTPGAGAGSDDSIKDEL